MWWILCGTHRDTPVTRYLDVIIENEFAVCTLIDTLYFQCVTCFSCHSMHRKTRDAYNTCNTSRYNLFWLFSLSFILSFSFDLFSLLVSTRLWQIARLFIDYRSSLQDTAGQERYRTITTAYYRGAMGFILMYDITNEESFNSVQDWVTQIKTYSWDNAQVILVGNKCDMEEERVISSERGRQLAEQLGVRFFETSAKENINVKVRGRFEWSVSRNLPLYNKL